MSEREKAYQLLDHVPDYRIGAVIAYLKRLTEKDVEEPNEETIEAMKETDAMIKNGTGQHFEGSAKDFIHSLLED